VAESTVATVSVPTPAVGVNPGVSAATRPGSPARRPPVTATVAPAAAVPQTHSAADTPTPRPEPLPPPVVVTAPAAPVPETTNPEAECRKIPKHQLVYLACMTKLCRAHPGLGDCQAFYKNAHAD
jgi:hypothetical protein